MIEKALAELTLNITDGKHGDCRGKDDSGYYFISCKDIREGQIHYEDARQIIEEDFWDTHKRTRLEPDDILVTNSGTIGRMAFVRDVPLTYRTTFQKSVAIVKPDKAKIFPKYLYYQLQNCVDDFINRSNGAAQKNLLLSTMRAFKMNIHEDEDLQMHIAAILSAYDDLIENNQKQIKLLEEAAQRLYKEWFVDLRFPSHETTPIVDGIPEGWSMCTAGNVIEFNPKTPLKKGCIKQSVPMTALSTSSMVLNSSEFTMTESNSGAKFRNGDTLLARITPCLENGKTAFVAGITSEEGAIGSTEFIVMRAKKINPYMVYLLARTEEFRKTAINSMTGSDGRQRAQVDKIMQFPYLLAPQSTLEAFSQLVEPIFEQVYLKNSQIAQLSQARDRLLPKLMSGEIEV